VDKNRSNFYYPYFLWILDHFPGSLPLLLYFIFHNFCDHSSCYPLFVKPPTCNLAAINHTDVYSRKLNVEYGLQSRAYFSIMVFGIDHFGIP